MISVCSGVDIDLMPAAVYQISIIDYPTQVMMKNNSNNTKKSSKKRLYAVAAAVALVLAVSLICCCVWRGELKYKMARGKAEKLVSSLTLEEKIGQMIMPAARTWSDTPEDGESYQNMTILRPEVADAVTEYNLCGICLFSQNCESTEQLVHLTDDLQSAAAASSSGIPLLISADQEGGYVTRLTCGTSMTGSMALAATGDADNAYTEAEIISSELKAVGINVDFAPDTDINDNPENPVIGVRAFSDNTDTVIKYAGAYIDGLHKNGIAACVKHFPGHGNTGTDSHTGLPVVDKSLEELEENELKPFKALTAKTDFVMTAHIQYPQVEKETWISTSTGDPVNLPATMSGTVITGILREKMGYDRVVVTDAFEMDAISDNFELNDAVKAAINADVDLILMPFDLKDAGQIEALGKLIADIKDMVAAGEIAESEIDDSVARILTLKLEKGILGGSAKIRSIEERRTEALSVVGSEKHHKTEWELAQEAVTLYQDRNGTYAEGIGEKEKVLYLCPSASQNLCLDLALQKLSEDGVSTEGMTFENICYGELDPDDIAEKLDEADRIILVTKTWSLNALDTENPENTSAIFCTALLKEAGKRGITVDLISSLLPYDAVFYKEADVILLAYNPSGVSELPSVYDGHVKSYGANLPAAIASLITGRKLTGTCPVDMSNIAFNSAGQIIS